MSRVEVVVNGAVAAQIPGASGLRSIRWSGPLRLRGSAWVAARAYGPPHRLVVNVPNPVFAQRESEVLLAHTSPVYVHAGGAAIASAADAAFFRDWVDRLMREVREEGVFDGDGQRREVLDLFARARQIYARTAGETGPARAAGAEYR